MVFGQMWVPFVFFCFLFFANDDRVSISARPDQSIAEMVRVRLYGYINITYIRTYSYFIVVLYCRLNFWCK